MTTVFLAPIGSGVGDVVVAMPVLELLVNSKQGPVYLVARGPRQLGFEDCIAGIAGVVREVDLPAALALPENRNAQYFNLRDHEIQRNYDWYGEAFERDYPGFRINDITREVCGSKGLHPDFSRFPPFIATNRQEAAGKVVIVPGATSDFKALPSATWKTVLAGLKERGIEYLMLGEPQHSPVVAALMGDGVTHLPTPTIRDAIDVVSSARAVISVDTGLMHIGVQQQIPTVAIFNRIHTYYREAPHCKPVFGPSCPPECAAQTGDGFPYPVDYKEWIWYEGKYEYCKSEDPCMGRIQPREVLDAFEQLMTSATVSTN